MTDNEYGYVKEGKVFRKGFRDFPDRIIGEIKTDEESSISYFKDRFQVVETKVETLENAVEEAENKGSYLMKLIHLKDYLIKIDAIGDFESLFQRLEVIEERLIELIAESRANNLLIKEALIEEAAVLKGSTNWKEDTDTFKDLKGRWIKTGNVEKQFEENLSRQFSEIVDDFFKRRQEYYQGKHRLVQNKLFKLKQVLSSAKLASKKSGFEARKELRFLQGEWKKVGKTTGNLSRSLNEEFKTINNLVFQNRGTSYGDGISKDGGDLADVLKVKKEMVERIKTLSEIESPSKANVEEVKSLQRDWKSKGMLPKEQNKTLSEAFYAGGSLVLEKHFILNLAMNKYKEFESLEEKEKVEIKLQITKDLLSRDQNELEIFRENLEKVNPHSQDSNKLIKIKLSQQARKVSVKKVLVEKYTEELKR